ncbi:MAG TPA: hypothetical protein VFP69_04310 [Streptomyces sp.]|nr:hypothetical protein [Streptomyces sp.]
MTSPTFSRLPRPVHRSCSASRLPLRVAAAAAGLAGALALTACGDGGEGGAGGAGGGSAGGASDAPSASAPSGGGDGRGLEGSWLATADGKAVALVVNGGEAGLFTTGGSVCSGTARDRSIRLTCADGDRERIRGTAVSVNRSTLTVTWEGAVGEETYTRSEGGKMPAGLPTAGLGS